MQSYATRSDYFESIKSIITYGNPRWYSNCLSDQTLDGNYDNKNVRLILKVLEDIDK